MQLGARNGKISIDADRARTWARHSWRRHHVSILAVVFVHADLHSDLGGSSRTERAPDWVICYLFEILLGFALPLFVRQPDRVGNKTSCSSTD